MDKVKIIDEHLDAITRGTVTLSQSLDGYIRSEFIAKIQRWGVIQYKY